MPPSVPPAAPVFTPTQRAALRQLRARYRAGGDLFTAPELARMRFLRWLIQTGRLVP